MTALETMPALPARLTQRGGSADLVAAEYMHVVRSAIVNHPRSLQRRIGPSELGHPCARRIGYKVLDIDENPVPISDAPWLPTVGTGVHLWLEDAFRQANARFDYNRYLVEMKVSVGLVGGVEITGSMDLYDGVTATVVDHKIVGPTQLKKYKSKGPGQQYRAQAHLYGYGARRRGLPVDTVMIAFLPRNGELREAYLWHEPYDESIALNILQRAEGIAIAAQHLGVAALAQLATADAYCSRCPFFRSGSTDLESGCPGHESGDHLRRRDNILDIV